ncbi:MAG: hypothetical protein ACLR0U_01265 [Enterocloster clostridioformis]
MVLILLIALMGLRSSSVHTMNSSTRPSPEICPFHSQTISGNLKSIETLSSVIISSSVIQDSLSRIDSTDDPLYMVRQIVTSESAQPSAITSRPTKITVWLLLRSITGISKTSTNFVVINNADTDTVPGRGGQGQGTGRSHYLDH